MDDSGEMRSGEPAPRLVEEREDLALASRPLAQVVRKRLPEHVLHRDEEATIGVADVVDRDDIGVRKLRHRLRFAQDALLQRRAARPQLAPQHLDSDLAIELRIVRRVDEPHTAGAEPVQDDVTRKALPGFEDLFRAQGRGARAVLRTLVAARQRCREL